MFMEAGTNTAKKPTVDVALGSVSGSSEMATRPASKFFVGTASGASG
jgi:hypothetical protein